MCVVCGCNNAEDHGAHEPAAPVALDPSAGDLHYGFGPALASVPGLGQARTVKLEADVLGANNRYAADNRAHFTAHGVTAYNLMSSPGSGKTTLLCATIEALRRRAIAEGVEVADALLAQWTATG